MPCGMLDAIYAFVHSWLASVGSSLTALRHTIQQAPHVIASAASILLSFESLIIVSFLSFAILGSALSALLVWYILCERDDYDDCENGLYYADWDRDEQWVGVAVPVILVGRHGRRQSTSRPKSHLGDPTPHRDGKRH
ncbi:hypothetical protein DFH09DRAFT_1369814 [Mycena vulgaris]|nr:hypothetical protein DFH09DRAFT_1369814 [Mycena vulgaris]